MLNGSPICAWISTAALLIAASVSLGLPAYAEDDPLYMQITRYKNLPADPKFSIETNENTELAGYAQADLKKALERHGVSYGRSAHLVIALTVAKIGGNRPPNASFDTRTGQLHIAIDPTQPARFPQVAYQ